MARSAKSFARRLLREPLVHFTLIGAALFAGHGLVAAPAEDDAPPQVIAVGPDVRDRLSAQFQEVWRRAPSAEEMAGLVDSHVRAEVLAREAVAMGLDRDDAVIRRRLQQKMEFLLERGANAVDPTEAALRDHHAAHPDRFTPPPAVTFEHVLLQAEDGDAKAVRAALDQGAQPLAVGRRTLLPSRMETAARAAVDSVFGTGFFERVAALPTGDWSGPVRSAYGLHLVRVIEAADATPPPFEAVKARVEEDWRREATADLKARRYDAVLSRYTIVESEVLE